MFKKSLWLIILISSTLALTSCTNPHTPAGNEGYVYEKPRIFGKGGFRGVIKGPSNYGVSLWNNKSINIDVRPTTYTENFRILAKDDLNVSFNFHAVLSITPGSIKEVVQNYGEKNWYNRFIKEPFRTFVRHAVQIHTSRELKMQRDERRTD